MIIENINNCILYNGAMEDTIGGIEHVDCIFTDPPYLYLDHEFDKPWNEKLFFENAKRLLPDDGFIALFGRGTAFYRWNTMLADLCFKFKEEIIWDKGIPSSYLGNIIRTHETLSVYTKKNGVIRKCRIPYIEHKQYDIEGIIDDVNRIRSLFNSVKGEKDALEFLETGKLKCHSFKADRHNLINKKGMNGADSRGTYTLCALMNGLVEKSTIRVTPVHLGSVHPTQKPVRLAERILALISDSGDTVYDPFMGSGSFGVACIRTGRKYIGSEINKEYFDIACKRIKEEQPLLSEAMGVHND
jgi:site-specific DNA-methyltransferase (adenine-specific)